MEEIIKGLEKNSQLRDSSCGAELQELLHQIDVMVNNKRIEWEQQSQNLETQLEMRELELVKVHTCLDSKQHEVDKLHQQLQDFENSHRLMMQKYEEQFKSLKSDLYQLHSTYKKLEKHQLKQAKEIFKVKIADGNGKIAWSRLNSIKCWKQKESPLVLPGTPYSQRKKKNKPQISDAKWNDWEQLELRESEIKYLKTCVVCAQDTIRSDEATIEQLKNTIEEKTTQEEFHQEEQQNLLEKVKCYQSRCQSRDDLLCMNHLEQKQLRKELARIKQSIMQEDDALRPMEQTNLEMELKSTLKQLEASNTNKTVLQAEIMRLKAELDLLHAYNNEQKNELSRKDEELQRFQNRYMERKAEINKVTMDQFESLKAENKHLKEKLQILEGKISMTENNQLKELQNAYAASFKKLVYDNKLLQKDMVKLKAEMEISTRTSQEKYEAALRHTQHVVAEMKEHENRRVTKLQQENEKQMQTLESKLEETVQHYEEKIKHLQKNCSIQSSFNISVPCLRSPKSREYSLERNLTPPNITADDSFCHCNIVTDKPFADINESGLTKGNFLPLTPTEISDISSVTEHFLEEEEERAQMLEKLLNSHIDELQADSKHTLKLYAGTKMDTPDTTASCWQCTYQDK
ncbi:centrosomal protein of 63 kDa-like isoform X2 [Narcine bancroftii]|uniref:centrosomal protein of 63 kDa-like isoform X2 n=1 Tax=Narcine bancroftii TaxID=1343680 RepID=UPI003831EB77